ncbi:MAG TPA: hypothetical protein VGK19_04530 [Capsulimonadaceae bacterium]
MGSLVLVLYGRAKVTSFELPKPLLELLWKSDFPDLQLVDSG